MCKGVDGVQKTLKVLDLFAGAGGFTIAGELAGGYKTVAFCEIDKHAQAVLRKNWPGVPIFDDVTKLKAMDIDGSIDVITGGFPCQDLSLAGRGAGIGVGTRSGLFREMLRLACEVREKQGRLPYIIFENVPRLLSGPAENPGEWFGEFLWALAEVGYDAEWFCISAASIGAPHKRERVCVVTYPHETPIERGRISRRVSAEYATIDSADSWWREGFYRRRFYRMDDGVSKRPHDIRNGIMGNAIVPQVFAIPMRALYEAHCEAKPKPC
jgi:DNA (cytosine-5)-methyltransferase 1